MTTANDVQQLETVSKNVRSAAEAAMEATGGLLRLAPCWVPRDFLHPGGRLKLDPSDLYAFGKSRGGIDERWFGSTTEAMNAGREPDEGLSYVVHDGSRFTLRDAVEELGATIVGEHIWETYGRWPVYSKFFDNLGPIPHHMHQSQELAELTGQEGKPEAYYFPPQHNAIRNNFPHTFFGLEPGTTREEVRRCLELWERGDNGILNLTKAYRLQPGTGWFVPPCVLHAPGSLCTYEPQWGSDVFGMFQSLVENRNVPWDLLVKDVPEDKQQDLDFIVDQLDFEANCDPNFKVNHYCEPIVDQQASKDGFVDRWVTYGRMSDGSQPFSAKELAVAPGVKGQLSDNGASSIIVTQGQGKLNNLPLDSPNMIGFTELTQDEVFITAEAARNGVTVENTAEHEPLVILRYFGPEVNPQAPWIGDATG
jgi:hypothetical protein